MLPTDSDDKIKNIYIVIPVFNRREITLNCLALINKQSYNHLNVVVVDDGSTDGTTNAIRENFPKTHIVKGNGNWWWTKSVNEGCKYALLEGAEAIVLMNDDVRFDTDYFQKLIDTVNLYPGSIMGSISLTVEKPHKIFFSGIKGRNCFTAKATKYHKQFETYDKDRVNGVHKTHVLPGRGLYIPSHVFDKIGFFNEKKLPQYFADFDFTNRAKRNGINVYINWDLIIYSFWKDTGKGALYVKQKFIDFLIAFTNKYSHRSVRAVFYYFKASCPWYLLPFMLLNHHLRVFYSYFKKRNSIL